MLRCRVCLKVYVTPMGCKRHMVKKHGYVWWDNHEICRPEEAAEKFDGIPDDPNTN